MPRFVVLFLLVALLPLLALGSRERGVRRSRSGSDDRRSSPHAHATNASSRMKLRVGIHDAAEAQLLQSSKSTVGGADHAMKKSVHATMSRRQSMMVTITETQRHLAGFDTRQDSYGDADLSPSLRHDKGAAEEPVAAQEKDEKEPKDEEEAEPDVETLIDESDKGKEQDDDELTDDLATNLGNQTELGNQTGAINATFVTAVDDGDLELDDEGGKEDDLPQQAKEEPLIEAEDVEETSGAKKDKSEETEDEDQVEAAEKDNKDDKKEDPLDEEDGDSLVVSGANVTNATGFETMVPTEGESDIAIDTASDAPSDNILQAQEADVKAGDDFYVYPDPVPGLVLIEPEDCISLSEAYWYMTNYPLNEHACMEDPNSCSGGCCRLDDHVRCDEDNSEPELKCICNQNTAANNVNTDVNKLRK